MPKLNSHGRPKQVAEAWFLLDDAWMRLVRAKQLMQGDAQPDPHALKTLDDAMANLSVAKTLVGILK